VSRVGFILGRQSHAMVNDFENAFASGNDSSLSENMQFGI